MKIPQCTNNLYRKPLTFTRNLLIWSCLFLFATLPWLASPNAAPTQNDIAISDTFTLDGKSYSKKQIINALLGAAFVSTINADPTFPKQPYFSPGNTDVEARDVFFDNRSFAERFPWLHEYLFREKGSPRYFAINKWRGPISISTGLPHDCKPFDGDTDAPYFLAPPYRQQAPDAVALIEATLEELMPSLRSLTGLPISYVPHEEETITNYGNLRIVLVDWVQHWATHFKKGSGDYIVATNAYPKPIPFRSGLEDKLHTAVSFTPSSLYQVDGLILSNSDNEIELAICYIWDGHSEQILRGLVRECVVRALGMPDGTDGDPKALLGLWNDRNAWPESQRGNLPADPPGLTEFDKFLIQMLYSERIEPGFSVFDVQRSLLRH